MKYKTLTGFLMCLFWAQIGCNVARANTRFSTAGFYSVEGSPRQASNFNPGWRFYKNDAKGAESIEFDDSEWEAANLPHGLEILGENASGGRNYQGPAWYRKRFNVDAHKQGEKVFLYFEAIMGHSEVWVNGKKVAEHFGGYLPFSADITDVLNPNSEQNIVAVRADNSDSKLYPPGQPQDRLDFTYMGGIYRDSYLIRTNPVHITLPEISNTVAGAGVFAATLDINDSDAEMEVRTEVANDGEQTLPLLVRTTLENAVGKKINTVDEKLTLKSGEKRQLVGRIEAKSVRLWHPDDPYLHYIKTEVISDGKVIDSLRTRVGIRLFEMRGPEGLFINKKWIGKKLIGANRHQDYAYVGNALPNSGQWRDVKLLREGGCNIIRAAHYPQDPAFYDACDELGMLTTTANPGWHFFNFKAKIFEERLYDDTRQLVRRDRNVASMLMWETCINEFPSQPDYAMNTMHNIAHEEYPFPGMFTVADHDEAKKGGFDMFYHGNDKEVNSFNREYGDGGEVDDWYSQNARTRVAMEWGENALLDQAIYQTDTLSQRYNTPKVQIGGSLWAGIDHYRGYHPDPFRGGLLNAFRLPRYTYYLYKSQYAPDYRVKGFESGPMVFNTHELTQLSRESVLIYSNCEEVRLTWMGKVVGTRKPSTDGKYKNLPHPPFVFDDVYDFAKIKNRGRGEIDEVMVAEGLIDGKVVVRDEKKYSQRTSGIVMQVDDEGFSLKADGSDFIPVRAIIIDQKGTKKVLASEYVHFKVEGPAEIIGDTSTYANPVKTSFGVATALIRATTQPGKITVTAYAKGLESGKIDLESIAPDLAMNFDESYVTASVKAKKDEVVIQMSSESNLPDDVKKLREELKRAQLEIVGKDQDLMELRSQLKN